MIPRAAQDRTEHWAWLEVLNRRPPTTLPAAQERKVPMVEHPTKTAFDALASVFDPCCRERGISIVDMGLVRSLQVEKGKASVELILTSGWCPFASRVLGEVKERLEAIPAIDHADVRVVWDQAWTMERMSDSARNKLRFLPHPAQVPDRQGYIARHMPSSRPGKFTSRE